ncbi:hypothetical protein COY28_04580 [Candidatus Woesearchaeota archaeon CG_4_10_14_0_2_um_filter_57_5]|nr:MAG: hypothetical protein COY28_04580 [Candidatus Woesearchaeota archaeon CG_4_10_14_0_2_um_filter_57_5]
MTLTAADMRPRVERYAQFVQSSTDLSHLALGLGMTAVSRHNLAHPGVDELYKPDATTRQGLVTDLTAALDEAILNNPYLSNGRGPAQARNVLNSIDPALAEFINLIFYGTDANALSEALTGEEPITEETIQGIATGIARQSRSFGARMLGSVGRYGVTEANVETQYNILEQLAQSTWPNFSAHIPPADRVKSMDAFAGALARIGDQYHNNIYSPN